MAADEPAAGYPRVAPYLLYEDVDAALGWLAAAFGFTERLRQADSDGTVRHAELHVGEDALVMLGQPAGAYRNPAQAGWNTALVHVMVDDVDAHCARARDAGATILQEPADQAYGHRRYDCHDPEGHLWSFAHPLSGAPPT